MKKAVNFPLSERSAIKQKKGVEDKKA